MNLGAALRTALMDETAISGLLGLWEGEPSIHTRRPAPEGALYPMIQLADDMAVGDIDGLKSRRPVVGRDISIYGEQPGDFRTVADLGWAVRELFHRKPRAISVAGYQVVNITASGPMPAPTSDQKLCGVMVALTITLRDLAT